MQRFCVKVRILTLKIFFILVKLRFFFYVYLKITKVGSSVSHEHITEFTVLQMLYLVFILGAAVKA